MHARPATTADAWAFAEVIAAVAAALERLAHALERGRDRFWVLEDDDGRVVGNLGLHPTHADGVVSLGMAIVAGARGRGGGSALLQAAMAWLHDSGHHKVELEVWPDNERAIALYERHGFEVEGLRRDHYRRRDGSLRSALIMARPVAQSRPGAGT
ncbi:MAG TPA: GNAT family N-acetyltransferase [Solirubrobacteraceae bacterium]|nr:GNAT family N-acetyltransferase [Solirubrobacteraceae bacterium]